VSGVHVVTLSFDDGSERSSRRTTDHLRRSLAGFDAVLASEGIL
jgi:hypothetical protein